MHTPITITTLRELIRKGEAKDPIVFLEALMSGQDPRNNSILYDLVTEIDEWNDGDIPKEDWAEIVSEVRSRYSYTPVSIAESHSAAVTLANYLHPKRKQVEMGGYSDATGSPADAPLTEEEIELFKEKFNDEF